MPARRIAIVTGGNRGIGHEIARQLMKADLFVVIGARDQVKCDAAVATGDDGDFLGCHWGNRSGGREV